MSEQPTQPHRVSVEDTFHAARSLAAAERDDYLQRACGNDFKLRQRIEALLRASESGRHFLPEQPGAKPGTPPPDPAAAAITEKPGDRIGNYELLEQIGTGGFGIVFKAKQLAPLQRIVALKIIKLGMDTLEVIARFEGERQTLAAMDHPNIAKVFDAGATVTGRPFFVMEYVEGISLTAYADQHRLPTRARLELFTAVCRAVQHAHTKGIIHRDLKPSNVLVTVQDGEPVPKLIDFGIAKATAQSVGFQTVATALGVIGTPAYMSPEQADLQRSDIDTRSDIYSLGVLLYELLTGQPPFEPTELVKLALAEVLKTIREREPPPPSIRLEGLAHQKLTETALNRQIEPTRLKHALRGDLDCIVMKCLEKDRNRRYESANDLATDVRRHLANQPIAASPPDIVYRLRKFSRRHRGAIGVGMAAFLAALCGWLHWWLLPGTLHLEVDPPDTQLEIDGRPCAINAMPADLKLAAGVHQLRFQKPEFNDELRTVVVPRGGLVSLPHLTLRHYQGVLDVDSTMPGTGIEFNGVDYNSRIHNQPVDSGDYDLLGHADECFEVRHRVLIQKDQRAADRLSLENAVAWTYRSTALQGDCVVITNCPPGQPPVLAENLLDQILFLSSADGSLLDSYPTPYGSKRSEITPLNLGANTGRILVTGIEDPENGPELTAIADAWPKKVLFEWHGPHESFPQPGQLSVTAFPGPGGAFRLAAAGRDGHVYQLDEHGHRAGPDILFSKTPLPLACPVDYLAGWNQSGQSVLLVVFHTFATNSEDVLYHGELADTVSGQIRWQKDFGVGEQVLVGDLDHQGVPSIIFKTAQECRIINAETGENRSRFPLTGHPQFIWLVNAEGPSHADLIFGFEDPTLPLLAVRPADGKVLWRGPANLSSIQHVNPDGTAWQTPVGTIPVMLQNSVVALESATGKVAWQIRAKPENMWMDEASGDIYLALQDGRMLCLNSTGGTNWTLRLHDHLIPRAIIPSGDHAGHCDVVMQYPAKAIKVVHWPRLLWNLPASQALQAAPLVVTNSTGAAELIQLLPGDADSALNGLDPATGQVLWSDTEFHLPPNRPPILADLDGDGVMDVVTLGLDQSGLTHLLVRRAADGKLIRAPRTTVPSWIGCTPAVADFTGTGRRDVAVATWDSREIVTVNGRTGEVLWRYNTSQPNMGSVTAADLDQDGLPDVVAPSMDGHVYALRGKDGRLFWQSAGTNCASVSRPVVCNLDGDHNPQVLVTTLGGQLMVLDGKTGNPVWSPALSGGMEISGQPTVASVDGRNIIIAPLGNLGVVAFDWQRRQEIWRSPPGGPVIATPVVADLAHDGNREVVIGSVQGEVMVLRLANGKVLWRKKVAKDLIEADPVVTDLNHDGIADILIASHDFTLYAIDGRAIVSGWHNQ